MTPPSPVACTHSFLPFFLSLFTVKLASYSFILLLTHPLWAFVRSHSFLFFVAREARLHQSATEGRDLPRWAASGKQAKRNERERRG
mmetsp:Transcript_2372/g.5008  ORF Transcript_2372/g.5008 Transcript_2372/m.5008 type:complete len:87 (-) Transcript_2372:353-613(-)